MMAPGLSHQWLWFYPENVKSRATDRRYRLPVVHKRQVQTLPHRPRPLRCLPCAAFQHRLLLLPEKRSTPCHSAQPHTFRLQKAKSYLQFFRVSSGKSLANFIDQIRQQYTAINHAVTHDIFIFRSIAAGNRPQTIDRRNTRRYIGQ